MSNIFTVLDISSSKIIGAVAASDAGGLTILAVEEEPLDSCMRLGCIANVEEVHTHVRNVIAALERRTNVGRKITGVYLAIGGRGFRSTSVKVSRELHQEKLISPDDINSLRQDAIEEALLNMSSEREIIDVVPREYYVDGRMVGNPNGTYGSSVSAVFNVLSWRVEGCRNLERVIVERAGLKILGYVVRPLAEAELVITDEERSLGSMLVDFGAQTTDVAIYKEGGLLYLNTIPLGSANITRDITAAGLTFPRAEQSKITMGNALPDGSPAEVADTEAALINEYVQARATEIVANIHAQLEYAHIDAAQLKEGIVLTGRGAMLKNFARLLEQYTKMHVRVGNPPTNITILDSGVRPVANVDILALARYVADNCQPEPEHEPVRSEPQRQRPASSLGGFAIDAPEEFSTPAPDEYAWEQGGAYTDTTVYDATYDDDELLDDSERARRQAIRDRDKRKKAEKQAARAEAKAQAQLAREQSQAQAQQARAEREADRQRQAQEKAQREREKEELRKNRPSKLANLRNRAMDLLRDLTDPRTNEEREEDERLGNNDDE